MVVKKSLFGICLSQCSYNSFDISVVLDFRYTSLQNTHTCSGACPKYLLFNFFPKIEVERGVPEKQMAAFRRGNVNEEDIQCQKCQFTYPLIQDKM